eukprot:1588215-Prymnesium_polylepis.1
MPAGVMLACARGHQARARWIQALPARSVCRNSFFGGRPPSDALTQPRYQQCKAALAQQGT